jgi:VIT family
MPHFIASARSNSVSQGHLPDGGTWQDPSIHIAAIIDAPRGSRLRSARRQPPQLPKTARLLIGEALGIAGLVAGATAMAAGEYVFASSQADTEAADLTKERRELADQPEAELDELTNIYVQRGLNISLARQVAEALTAKDAFATHARDELGLSAHVVARPGQAALTSAVMFAFGAATLRRKVTGNSSGKRKLYEELPKPGLILADVGIDLAVGALEVGVANHGRPAVPRSGDVNHVQVIFLDDAIQVDVDEILPGGRAPVSQQHVLHIRERQRSLQQRIVIKINLPDRKIVGRPPIGIQFFCSNSGLSVFEFAFVFIVRLPSVRQAKGAYD